MRRYLSAGVAGVVLGGVFVAAAAPPALANSDDLTAATVLDLASGISVTSSAHPDAVGVVQNPLLADPRGPAYPAVPLERFNEFPLRGGGSSYVALSTGRVSDLFDPSEQLSSGGRQPSFAIPGHDGAPGSERYDISTLTIDVPAQSTSKCLVFDLAMGTEERAFDGSAQPDAITVTKQAGDGTNYAKVAGEGYAPLPGTSTAKADYAVGQLKHWTLVGSGAQSPSLGTAEDPRIPAGATAFDYFTSPSNVEVPIAAGGSSKIDVTISDAGQQWRDSIALVDRIRLADMCSDDPQANPGITTNGVVIKGNPGVGNVLTVDLEPTAGNDDFEQHDAATNGWLPAGAVDLHFRWYHAKYVGAGYCQPDDQWVAIPGADRQTFVPTESMKGRCVIARVTGSMDDHVTQTYPALDAASWQTPLVVGNGVFTKTSPPAISGPAFPKVGDVLSVPNPGWEPTPATYEYQWLRQLRAGSSTFVRIEGATGREFTATAAEAGLSLQVDVKAGRYNFTDRTVASSVTNPVAYLTYTSRGSAGYDRTSVRAGETISAVAPINGWDPEPESRAYQWYVNGVQKSGATQSSYTPTASDSGKRIAAEVTYLLTGYAPVKQMLDAIVVDSMPITGGEVSIGGSARVGSQLTASAGAWDPRPILKYQWLIGSKEIGKSTRLTVPPEAVGKRIRLVVTGSKTNYEPKVVVRDSAVVAPGALVVSTPRATGSARPGGTVRVSASWGPRPVTLRYQWYVGSKAIKGATKSSYKIAKKYRNKKIRVRVIGSKTGYTTVTRYSSFVRVAKK